MHRSEMRDGLTREQRLELDRALELYERQILYRTMEIHFGRLADKARKDRLASAGRIYGIENEREED